MAFDLKKSFSSMTKKLKGKGNKKYSTLTYVIGGGVATLVIFLIVMSIGLYKYQWSDRFTHGVTKVIPYPVSSVNGRFVSYSNYLDNLNIMKKYQVEFKKVDLKSEDGKKVLETIKRDTLDRLNEDVLVKTEAKKLKVSLTKKEIDDSFADLIKSNGGESEAKPGPFGDVLMKYYGLSISDFKNEIYKDRLLRQKVAEKFVSDESVNIDAKKKAEEILGKVKAGEDFAALAKQYSQDTTAENGGDLGFFAKGKMVPEFEQAAFGLKAGETSGVVKTVYGYHIIKVFEVNGDQIKASHILVKTKDFNAWLEDAKITAKIKELIKVEKK